MQSSLLILFAAVVAVTGLAAWLGFSGKRRYALRYRVVTGLGALGLTPFLLFVLVRQSRAADEIAAWGLTPHPATLSAEGLPVRSETGGSWSFTVAAPTDSIRAFYLETLEGSDWRLSIIHPRFLAFEREGQNLAIHIRDGRKHPTVTFMVDPRAD